MRNKLIGFLFAVVTLHAQPLQQVHPNPDCQFFFSLTAANQFLPGGNGFDNRQQGCTSWNFSYVNSGFTGLTVTVQSAANNNGAAGSWGTGFAIQQNTVSGSNAASDTTGGFWWVQGTNAFVRVILTNLTGSGVVNGAVYGWRIPNAASAGGGGGGITCLSGDVAAGSGGGCTTATVVGLETVPFCSGYTPTNGQFVQYTTGGSPNPCYTAATASGGGGGGGSGVTVYSGVAGISLSGTVYFSIGGGADASALPGTVDALMESAGTMSDFAASISIALGTGASVVLTVYQNFATTAITCTITNPATTCVDTSHSIAFSPGDTIAVQAVFTGSIIVTPTFVFTTQTGTTATAGVAPNPAASAPTTQVPFTGWTLQNVSNAKESLNDFLPNQLVMTIPNQGAVQFAAMTRSLSGATYTLIATVQVRGTVPGDLTTFVGGVCISDGTKYEDIEVFMPTTSANVGLEIRTTTALSSGGSIIAGPTIDLVGPTLTVMIVNDGTHRTWSYWQNGSWTQFLQEATGTFLTETTGGMIGLVDVTTGGYSLDLALLYWSN